MNRSFVHRHCLFIVFAFALFASISCNRKEETTLPQNVNLKFYFDNSASNEGYFRSINSSFVDVITDLMVSCKNDTAYSNIIINLISKEVVKVDKTPIAFIQSLATQRQADQEGFPLNVMFEKISADMDTNDIVFFISDCILSFPDSDIKQKNEINKEQTILLQSGIKDVFTQFKKKGLVASVYAFKSDFKGRYYNYRNEEDQKGKEVNESRPFYIWVIGKKDLMQNVSSTLSQSKSFQQNMEHGLHFGYENSTVTAYKLIPMLMQKGEWFSDSDGISDLKSNNEDPGVHFMVGMNLNDLPPYARDYNFLKDHIKVEVMKGKYDMTYEMVPYEKFNNDTLKSTTKKNYDYSTNLLLIKLNDSKPEDGAIRIYLKNEPDSWYYGWSCDSDLTKAERENKTFALSYLIEGVNRAYNTDGKNFIDFTINIEK